MNLNELFIRIQKLFGINEDSSEIIFSLKDSIRHLIKTIRRIERFMCSLASLIFLELFFVSIIVLSVLLIFSLFFINQISTQVLLLPIASVTAFVAMFTLVCNHRVNTIRHYAENEARIRELEKTSPFLYNMAEEDEYNRAKDKKGFVEYDSLAHQSLTLCLEIFNEPFWNRTLKLHFIIFFERVRKLHHFWFDENASIFPEKFIRYMKAAEWRELIESAHADQLRWQYEVDLYDRSILSPLHKDLAVKELYPLIDEAIKKFNSKEPPYNVADMGCGNGKLTEWLAGRKDIKIVQGLDYSVNMIQAAKKRAIWNSKMEVAKADLRDLKKYENKYDRASGIAYHNALIYLYSINSSSFALKICLRL